MKNNTRSFIAGLLYFVALLCFIGAIMVSSGGRFFDLSGSACLIFCGAAIICVIAATLFWKVTDARGNRRKMIVMVIAIAVIIGGGFLDNYLDHNTGTHEYTADIIRISESVAAKFETADGKSVMVDGEINLLKSLAELDIQETPMTPANEPDDWLYRITFNSAEKVLNSEEIIVYVHEKYLQIGNEYYLPPGNVGFDHILEWFHGKAAYFFD